MPNRIPYAKSNPHGIPVARPDDRARAEAEAERKRFYNGARWRKFRLWFLGRHPVCVDCLEKGQVTPATTPHHLQERLDRPDLAFTESNMIGLCSSCHSRRHKGKDGQLPIKGG